MHGWMDIQEAARHNSTLQTLVTYVEKGGVSREEALIVAVLTLVQQIDDLRKMVVGEKRIRKCVICTKYGCSTCHDVSERCPCARDGRT
jgi:hypothetical protein